MASDFLQEVEMGSKKMSNFRVFIAIETFLPLVGGSERQAFLQSKYLRAQGIETTILTLHIRRDCPAFECLERVPVLRVAGRLLSLRDRLAGPLRRLCYLFAVLALAWQLWRRRNDYDILHVFQLTLFTLPALLVCRLTGKPLVIGMRCDSPRREKDRLKRRSQKKSWVDLKGLARLGKPAMRLIARELRKAHARILILSAHMRESLSEYGLKGVDVCLIPNGVDTLHFHPVSEQADRDATRDATVVCVAKLRYQKGIDILLHAWRFLIEQMPEARLLIVGDGPLLGSLQELARELKIASSVEFVGFCADPATYLQCGRIAVLPSRQEGMPNALLEAMSCGLACVATRVSGSEDLLDQGERGLLVELGGVEGLAGAMLCLLKDTARARRYGQMARRYIDENYTFQSIMHRHLQLYRVMLEEHRERENG